jgi:hypothetical protein
VPLPDYTHMATDPVSVTELNRRTIEHFQRHLGVPH